MTIVGHAVMLSLPMPTAKPDLSVARATRLSPGGKFVSTKILAGGMVAAMDFAILSEEARQVADRVIAALPVEVRDAVGEAGIFFETRPGIGDIEAGIDPELLGYFDPGPPEAPSPRIRLWLANLWDYAEGDGGVFREEVEITLLHEIGHLLGWDEEDVEERGLG